MLPLLLILFFINVIFLIHILSMFIKHFFFKFILLFIREIESIFSFVIWFLSFTQIILI